MPASGFMGRGSSSASDSSAAESSSTASTAASNNSAAAGFKAFSGKGKSIGGNPVGDAQPPPRINSQAASASRGRSDPASRAAAQPAAPGARAGAALVAKLEEKKKAEANSSSAIATTDVGHDMDPLDNEGKVHADPEDKNAAAYAAINETGDSV